MTTHGTTNTAALTWLAAVALATAAGCTRSPSEVGAAPANRAAAATRGAEIAEKMLATYRNARSYEDRAVYVQQAARKGEGIERESPFFRMSLAFQRPGRLRLKFEEAADGQHGRKAYDIAFNGELVRAAAAEMPDQILEAAAPPSLAAENVLPDPVIRRAFEQRSLGDVFPQLAMLLDEGDQSVVFPHDEAPRLVDVQPLGGRDCFRVATTSPAGTRVLWIDAQDYTLRRMVLPIDSQREELDASDQYSHLEMRIDFEEAQLDARLSRDAFDLEVPAGAVRVREFVAPAGPAPIADLGEPLADVQLASISGDPIPGDSLKGKTVLLTLWQVDCPSCRTQAPRLAQVLKDLDGADDFAALAVNIDPKQIPDEAVQQTYRDWGGAAAIARLEDRESLEKLRVAGTPTLLLLDAQGNVQHRRLGLVDDASQVREMVDRLRDGADLAAEARVEYRIRESAYQQRLAAVRIAD